MDALPIDSVLPQIVASLVSHPSVVIQAPPGAGKTTRIPLALLDSPFFAGKTIIMLEPRRLAAANAARWMASLCGEEVGQTVGYSIRFQRKVSSATRLEVVTEGLLVRRLQADPALAGVGVVIFDEFHERNLQADTALALCLDVQRSLRDDLKLMVMSATLDGEPVARLLGNAPLITSEGRSYPVKVQYCGEPGKDLARSVAQVVDRATRESSGDMLVFLPGTGEIRRCQAYLQEMATCAGLQITPLYGDLPFTEQEKAIQPSFRRKVVLATSIAETSLTIQGVSVVIDSGLTRRLRYDPATGLNRLITERVSLASAQQRSGRAGRLGPGSCYRLWSEQTQQSLLPFSPPEIKTADLGELALNLALWGIPDAASLPWLDGPPAAALAEARSLLTGLGALDAQYRITSLGRQMAELPMQPRLARMLLAGVAAGEGGMACDLAAILGERDLVRSRGDGNIELSSCDYLDRLEFLRRWRSGERMGPEVDTQACRAIDQVARHLCQLLRLKVSQPELDGAAVSLLLARAYPERLARQREPGSERYLLANGRGARLGRRCAVRNQQFLVAVAMDAGEGGDGVIHGASAIDLLTLHQEFADEIVRQRQVVWDWQAGRIAAREEERLGALVLTSRPCAAAAEEAAQALVTALQERNDPSLLPWSPVARQFQARVNFLRQRFPDEGWPDFTDKALLAELPDWFAPYVLKVSSLAALARIDLLAALQGRLSWDQLTRLNEGAPTHLTTPGGSRIQLDYVGGDGPVLAVKLQELFGCGQTPLVAWGAWPVLIHLLSPAGRPIQVTRDLANFWNTVYPQVKKELKGRYPKHPWPDDPWSAVPTSKTKRGMRVAG